MEKISVIIPCFNAEKQIEKCVQSVLQQDYENIEIIIIDDGSQDGSGKIIDALKTEDSRIVTVHQQNKGVAETRNVGIRLASGRYVSFVDADDYVSNDYLSYLYSLIKRFNCRHSVCRHENINPNRVGRNSETGTEFVLNAHDYFSKLCRFKLKGIGVSPHSRLYEKSLFKDISYPSGKLFEDSYTSYKLVIESERIAIGTKTKYFYVRNKNSIVQRTFDSTRMQFIDAETQMRNGIIKRYPDLLHAADQRLDYAYLNTLGHALLAGGNSYNKEIEQMLRYIKGKRLRIIFNKDSTKKDRLAAFLLLFGKNTYKLNFKIFKILQARL